MIENVFKCVQTKENTPIAEELTAHENRCYTPNVPKKGMVERTAFPRQKRWNEKYGNVFAVPCLTDATHGADLRAYSDVFTGINTFEYVLKGRIVVNTPTQKLTTTHKITDRVIRILQKNPTITDAELAEQAELKSEEAARGWRVVAEDTMKGWKWGY